MPTSLCISFSSALLTTLTLFLVANSATYWEDINTLKQLKNGLDPNSLSQGSCLSSWDFSLDPCETLFTQNFTCGFRCDVVDASGHSRVTELALDQAGYSGQLNSTTWNLPYLQTLDLSGNLFSGSIPDSLSNLTQLHRLALSGNSLSGYIPASLGFLPNLEELYLDNNKLQAEIPVTLKGLKNLKRLELQGNKLTGPFPDLSQLINVDYIDASDNAISGELPANFPLSLIELSMRNNKIEGNIPVNISSLTYLQVIDLSRNNLTGSVPSGLFNHPSLQQLTLSNNRFRSVELPGNRGNESELIAVDLSNNELHGFLPAFMGLMPKLSALSLENNKLTGMIPTQYGVKTAGLGEGVSAFERLLLGGNYLVGVIPSPLMKLKPGTVTVRLGDNCLYRCPASFFFCQGGVQKPLMECKRFGPVFS